MGKKLKRTLKFNVDFSEGSTLYIIKNNRVNSGTVVKYTSDPSVRTKGKIINERVVLKFAGDFYTNVSINRCYLTKRKLLNSL